MPVTDKHPEYVRLAPLVEKCRDCVEGEEAVKARGTTYLPKLKGQGVDDYESYKGRALFYTAAHRTVKGLAGVVCSKSPEIEYPTQELDALDRMGIHGESVYQLLKMALEEVLTAGRVLALVDMPQGTDDQGTTEPYMVLYKAEDVINWKTDMVAGRVRFTMLVLRESVSKSSPDGFGHESEVQYRVLRLVTKGTDGAEDDTYTVQIYTKAKDNTGNTKDEWIGGEVITPKARGGKSLPIIPAIMLGVSGVGPQMDKPPILDLANVNLSHYRTSADLEHGRHFTALPTLCLSGWDAQGEVSLGSATAITATDPNAKAAFLEFTGAGLGHLASALTEKQQLMAVLGARLLEQQKSGVEAADTVRLRQAGEHSVLANVAMSVAEGFTLALQYVQVFQGQPLDQLEDVYVELPDDYGLVTLDPAMMQTLMAALQGGQISWSTWFYNLQRSGITPDGVTEEQEREKIEANPVAAPSATLPGDGGDGSGASGGDDDGGASPTGEPGGSAGNGGDGNED
jgi:hypothetical protein